MYHLDKQGACETDEGLFAFGGAGLCGPGAGQSLRGVHRVLVPVNRLSLGAAGLLGVPGVTLLILLNAML